MASSRARLTPIALPHPTRRLRVGLVCLVAALAYAAIRVPMADVVLASYARTCARMGLRPGEWLCGTSGGRALTASVVGSLLIGAAVALPCLVLALTGRRLTAFTPLVACLVTSVGWLGLPFDQPSRLLGISEAWPAAFGVPSLSFWQLHPVLTTGADLLLVAIPALAVIGRKPASSRDRPMPPRRAAVLASLVVLTAIGVVAWISGFLVEVWGPGLVMATFAAVLGTDRRWWPWVIAPVAVLLSLGPAMAVLGTLTEFTTLTWFRSVLPLTAIGLAASCWRPVASAFSGLPREPGRVRDATPRAVRPVVVANAVAAGLVAVSFLAFRYDPLPTQISEVLPTYLGARVLADDVRAKTNLYEAIGAMQDRHRVAGTYEGFDATEGEAALGSLSWSSRPTTDPLVVHIDLAATDRAEVVTISQSGTAFCLRSTDGRLTIGEGDSIAEARRGCDAVPWSARELAMIDFAEICGEAPGSSVLLCRAVERNIDETLATSSF